MDLEILSETPSGPQRPFSLLFVHGICLGAWVWREHFLAHFAERGYASHAVSLRGHGGSGGRGTVRSVTLAAFAADLQTAMDRIDGPVVLIGHSMGGGVVQFYLQQGGSAAGVVLLASAPPHGLLRASWAMFQRNPALWRELERLRRRGIGAADSAILEDGLFSRALAAEARRRYLARLGEPAVQAAMELMGWRPIAPFPWAVPPLLVIGGGADMFIPPADVSLTAAYYGVRAVIIDDAAHAMMLDANWRAVADAIAGWLEGL